jgi:tetratricopeptide (TPR) repeat protein
MDWLKRADAALAGNTDERLRAALQNALGNAYRDLAGVEARADNLHRAIAAYTEALRFYTPDAAPLDYAMTQNGLGIALEDSGDLAAAVRCWREAEHYYRAMGDAASADRVRAWIADAERRLAGGTE